MNDSHKRAKDLVVGDRVVNMSGTAYDKPMLVTNIQKINGEKMKFDFEMVLSDGEAIKGARIVNRRAFVEVS